MAETQIEWLHEAWYIHSCLFHVKTSSKRGRYDPTPHCSVNWGVYTAITPHQRAPNHAIHCLNFLNKKELIGKMILCFLSRVTIYKTGSSQLSSTRALFKTMLFLFGNKSLLINKSFIFFVKRSKVCGHFTASSISVLLHLMCQRNKCADIFRMLSLNFCFCCSTIAPMLKSISWWSGFTYCRVNGSYMCIVMFEADVITNVSIPGRSWNEQFTH